MSKPTEKKPDVRTVTCAAMLCAVAYVVMWVSKTIFAPLTVAGILTFDLKDTIIAVGGFLYGPLTAFIISVVVSLIEMVTRSETGPIGLLMNILSTVAFVCPAALLYRKRRTAAGAVAGLVLGAASMAAVMLLWNYLITPIYQGVSREVVAGMLLPVFLPFNLIKAAMNAALTMAIYKPVVTALRKARLVPESQNAAPARKGLSAGVTIAALLVLATAVVLGLVLAGVL